MDVVKITSAITGNDPGAVYPVLWKQKSVKVEKGRIRTIRGEKEMMRGTVDSTQEGNKKMRSYLKILIATALIGVACFAGTKEVKADAVLEFTENNELSYMFDDEEYAGKSIAIKAELDETTITIATIAVPSSGIKEGKIESSTLMSKLGKVTEDTDYTVEAFIGDEAIGNAEYISVYCFNPTIDDNKKLKITSPSKIPYITFDDSYDLEVEAIAPYFISEVDGVSQNAVAYSDPVCSSDAEVTSGEVKAIITCDTTSSSPINASIEWENGEVYPYQFLEFKDTEKKKSHTIKMTYPTGDEWDGETAVIKAAGEGTFELEAKVNSINDIDSAVSAGKGTFSYNISEIIDHVVIYRNGEEITEDTVSVNATETYTAIAYLDEEEEEPASADYQIFDWGVSNKLATIKDGKLKTGGSKGNVTVSAICKKDKTKSGSIQVTIDMEEVEALLLAQDTISVGYVLNLQKSPAGAVEVIPEEASGSVKSITYDYADTTSKNYGTLNSAKTALTGKAAGKVRLSNATVTYTDGITKKFEGLFDEITVISNNFVNETGDSSDEIKFEIQEGGLYTGTNEAENLSEIKGYQVDVIYDGKVVYTTSSSKKSGEVTLNKEALNKILSSASSKLSGDSPDVTFKVSPYGTGEDGSTKVVNSAAAISLTKKAYKNGNTYSLDQTSSSSSSSSMKSSSGQGSGSGSDYDKVPKTGEGNTRLLIIMIAVISATIAGSILLSNLPVRSKSGTDESVDEKDVFHKKD